MGKRAPLPIEIGGQYTAGDGGSTPPGTSLALNNLLTRPSRYPARPPFKYDGLMSINGLANFDDTTNRVTRLLAVDTTQHLYEKATSGESWGSANATLVSGTRLTDSANYRGVTYMMLDDGSGLPSAAASFDGTNVSTTPFSSVIQSRTITTYDERNYLAYPRVTVTPLGSTPTVDGYDWSSTNWIKTNTTASLLALSGGINTCRLSPTSSAAGCSVQYLRFAGVVGLVNLTAPSGVASSYVWRAAFRGVDPIQSVPITMEWFVTCVRGGLGGITLPLGYIITAGGFMYRVTTAGVSAVGPGPAYTTTIGGTTTDGTLVVTCIGTDTIAALESSIDGLSINPNFTTKYLAVVVPTFTNTSGLFVSPRLKLYNSANPLLAALAPIDISLKDGLADGDIRKANYGHQWTAGDYFYPFFNTETATTATIDLNEIVWSELGDPKTIRASNTYKLREAVGYPQAATTLGGRYLVGKRNAIWQFQDTGEPDIPIRREKYMAGIGVVGPRAHDKYEDDWFFIGENEIYRYNLGSDIPKAICGDGMREVVMSKGADWVESQSVYKRPLLAIDQTRLILWAYTQKGRLFAYDLRSQRWSTHYVSNGAEVDCMIWNASTGNFYVSFGGHGLTRMDYTAAANDTINNIGTEYAGDISVVLHPIESPNSQRFDATVEELRILYASSIAQTGPAQTVTVSTSFDQGATYAHTVSCTPSVVSTAGNFIMLPVPVWQTGSSLTLKVARSGKLGEQAFALSPRVEAMLNVRRGELPLTNPTAGAVS